MRSRAPLYAFLGTLVFLAVPLTASAGIPFFGPIIPPEFNTCPAGWGMIITVINNIIQLLLTLAIVFVAPLMIAWSGFLFVVNPVNSGGIQKAKDILIHTIVGIVIALAGWMIVDALMAVLYKGSAGSTKWGTWSTLITSGNLGACLQQAGAPYQPGVITAPAPTVRVPSTSVGRLSQCPSSNTACSPAALQAAGFNPVQANVMSCIAMTESSGNPTARNGNAVGLFQIMLTVNPLVGSACGGTLSCPSLCKGSNGAAVQTASCQPCVQAAVNAQCNAQSAQSLVSKSGYTPWTCAGCNNKATSCIQQYGT